MAPEIIPLLPPKIDVINPTKKAAYKPTKGSTCATNANAMASGTNARATVSPDRISAFGFLVKLNHSRAVLYWVFVSEIKEIQSLTSD